MRGIGYTASNFIANLPKSTKHYFVFYIDKNKGHDITTILESINVPKTHYEVQTFSHSSSTKQLPGKLKYITKAFNTFKGYSVYLLGDSKYPKAKELDSFIQLDQSLPLPILKSGAKKYFIAYDLIPYVLESDYLWSYPTSRRHGKSRKSSLKAAFKRFSYIQKIKINAKKASKILAISETTKRDFIRYAGVPDSKIDVITLGVNILDESNISYSDGTVDRYYDTSWGYLSKKENLTNERFLLFVGGADERRRLDDLVAAFNSLKAQGSNLKLVLSGDIMKGPKNIPSSSIRKSLETSSYINDIYFVGFTDDNTRNWLYRNATAFVFPSIYEGFGLPILEALSFKTPVICYGNSAVKEVAGNTPFYTYDVSGLIKAIRQVETQTSKDRDASALEGFKHAQNYSWSDTARQILKSVSTKA
jgi:glycosyltransferase involved in cell wall biosynthesis